MSTFSSLLKKLATISEKIDLETGFFATPEELKALAQAEHEGSNERKIVTLDPDFIEVTNRKI